MNELPAAGTTKVFPTLSNKMRDTGTHVARWVAFQPALRRTESVSCDGAGLQLSVWGGRAAGHADTLMLQLRPELPYRANKLAPNKTACRT